MGPIVGGIVTLIFIVVAIVQALTSVVESINRANDKSKIQPMPDPNVPLPSSFLPELNQQKKPHPTSAESRQMQNPKPQKSGNAGRGQQGKQKQQQNAGRGKPQGPAANSRTVGSLTSGSGVGAHVDSFIGQHVKSHIGNQLSDTVKNDINDQVRSHLGEDRNQSAAPTATSTHGSAAAEDLLNALRSPQGVRQAILISEVLGKPKALRRP